MPSIMADYAANYAFLEAFTQFLENNRSCDIVYFGLF